MKKMYPNSWGFNARAILESIDNVVIENGGSIVADNPITAHYDAITVVERTNTSRVMVSHHEYLYTRFALNGAMYYVQLDDNPFFGMHYCKSAMIDETRAYSAKYLNELPASLLCGFNEYSHDATDSVFYIIACNIIKWLRFTANYNNGHEVKKLYPITVNRFYDAIVNHFGEKPETVYEDVILNIVGKVGLYSLKANHLIESCAVLNGRKLYAF